MTRFAGPYSRASFSPEKSPGVKRSHTNIPVHPEAIGLAARVSPEEQMALFAMTQDACEEILHFAGIKSSTLAASGLLRIKTAHAVTIAPVSQVGMQMHEQALTDRQRARTAESARVALGHSAKQRRFKQFAKSIRIGLSDVVMPPPAVVVEDIDWYGANENVLVARLDTSHPDFQRITEMRQVVTDALTGLGIAEPDIYPADHITLARFGTKRRPIEFVDDVKAMAKDVLRPELVGTAVSLGDFILTKVDGESTPVKPSALRTFRVSVSNELE